MKKGILKTILEKIKPYRGMASDFLIILDEVDEKNSELIDKLYNKIIENIRKIESKNKLQKISKELKAIRKKELIENKKNIEDVKKIESLIDSID